MLCGLVKEPLTWMTGDELELDGVDLHHAFNHQVHLFACTP